MKDVVLTSLVLLVSLPSFSQEAAPKANLLLNPTFEFHYFDNHRLGERPSFASHNVAFWNTDAWGDITVVREAHVDAGIRPPFTTHNLVSIAPGKRFWQFFTLPEADLGHGDQVSLHVFGHQAAARALRASVKLMKLDSEDGTWKPSEFGMGDGRTFPRHARGELVAAHSYDAFSDGTGAVELRIEAADIIGRFREENARRSDDVNTIGVRVEFANEAAEGEVWVYAPSLCVGDTARPRLAPGRAMTPHYRHIPRTIQKLWKGEPIHILAMGSSIDRGSANPPMYLYDEDPNSPTFKEPLSDRAFEAERVGRSDLAGYIGWWQHYFCYTGRLRLELMRKFNLPVDKICLNIMARDGSCVGEAHSGLQEYCSLSQPPDPGGNGHASGTQWRDLYPELFTRPEGPRPDLVIFGSGANEDTDMPDEVAVFEGTIRWIQRHYPNTEFLFCMFQRRSEYTHNVGDLQALALRYQIPYLDFGKVADELTRWGVDEGRVADFVSKWGSPYGSKQVVLLPGQVIAIDVVATDVSIAYADAPEAGTLKVSVDGAERLVQPATAAFSDIGGNEHYMENRRGILGLGYGLHTVRIEAVDAPVAVLGLYTYDSRPNRDFERRLVGRAVPGETVAFSQPFKARPVVLCQGGLAAPRAEVTVESVRFGGDSPGTYEIIGE